MIRLALLSIVRRRGGVVPTGLVVLVGVVLLSGMAGVMATGLAPTTPDGDRDLLVQFPAILGSWILGIVVFAVVSTVGVALGGRVDEIRGLRLVGATPGQVQRMVAGENLVVAAVAAVPGVLLGYGLQAGVVAATASTGAISGTAPLAPGVLLPVAAGVVIVVAAAVGAFVGSREAARRSPVGDPSSGEQTRAARPRRCAAALLLAGGFGSSATVLSMAPNSVHATAATGPGCVLVAIGAALLAPELLRLADHSLVVVVLRRLGGPGGRLAAANLRTAPARSRPAVTFLVLFVGVAAGTLSMQAIENRAASGEGIGQLMATINYLVVVLIAAFMSIALVNNLVASIRQRRAELSVLSSIGATVGQSTRMLLAETGVATVVAVTTGFLGSTLVVLPFAVVKTGSAAAAVQGLPLLAVTMVAGGIAMLTTVTSGTTTARAARIAG